MIVSQVRGYVIAREAAYLRSRLGEDGAKKLFAELSPDLQRAVADAKPASWYPIALLADLHGAIVTRVCGGDEARAREALIACGKFVAHEATNMYLRLLMRMLSPSLFAKKMPDFFQRDHMGGKIVMEVNGKTLRARFSEIAGYDHIPALAGGYALFAFEAMQTTVESLVLHDWSLSNPCAEGAGFELTWKE
jgi:hypothetical protein